MARRRPFLFWYGAHENVIFASIAKAGTARYLGGALGWDLLGQKR
jgi:hypothetical protein